jgi:hypothetical protein
MANGGIDLSTIQRSKSDVLLIGVEDEISSSVDEIDDSSFTCEVSGVIVLVFLKNFVDNWRALFIDSDNLKVSLSYEESKVSEVVALGEDVSNLAVELGDFVTARSVWDIRKVLEGVGEVLEDLDGVFVNLDSSVAVTDMGREGNGSQKGEGNEKKSRDSHGLFFRELLLHS